MTDPVKRTLAYYNEHAEEFVERTAKVPMGHLYEPFLELIPPGGKILDAGCGSGRDAAEFARRGYQVTAFDGSAVLAQLASQRSGLQVLHQTFDDINWRDEFDGVWACASLLHLPSEEIGPALDRIGVAMRSGGVLFVSMKAGQFEGTRERRWFTDTTPTVLQELLTDTGLLEPVRVWETEETRPSVNVAWVNALARRVTPTR
ncbi:MAG: class I SAM-dependent methyltransferase [Vicinamibacterales bacterium]